MAAVKTCKRGHTHDAARCPECARIHWQRAYRHKTRGDAPPQMPGQRTHCQRGHLLPPAVPGVSRHCRACANAARRKARADRAAIPRPEPVDPRSSTPVVTRLRERKATRDPWAALIFGGPA